MQFEISKDFTVANGAKPWRSYLKRVNYFGSAS
jgi:hypothetical protein